MLTFSILIHYCFSAMIFKKFHVDRLKENFIKFKKEKLLKVKKYVYCNIVWISMVVESQYFLKDNSKQRCCIVCLNLFYRRKINNSKLVVKSLSRA